MHAQHKLRQKEKEKGQLALTSGQWGLSSSHGVLWLQCIEHCQLFLARSQGAIKETH